VYFPCGQILHVSVTVLEYFPSAQSTQFFLVASEYFPRAHCVSTPAGYMYPAVVAEKVHALASMAGSVVVYVPLAQSLQDVIVAAPVIDYFPRGHCVIVPVGQ